MSTRTAKPNAVSRCTNQLRDDLLNGIWKPAEKLQPQALATTYQVSTTVIREALTRLSGHGLVISHAGRGFFVRSLSLQELEDITELRCASDALALKLSIERGDIQWESHVTALHHQLSRTPRRDSTQHERVSHAWTLLHQQFHLALISACDCEPMITLSENLMLKTELYRQWSAPEPAAVVRDVEQEHKELVEATLERDIPLATQKLTEHYRRTVEVVLKAGILNGH